MAAATTFADLPLHGDVQRALERMHFRAPSPIQLRALPLALFGNDVVGQAKSGTGKTAVFGVTAVEHVIAKCDKLQSAADVRRVDPLVLVLAPTREIALQIDAVLHQLAHFRPTCTITTAIGGLPLAQDKENLKHGSHIVVGTPGRVKALVMQRVLQCHALRLLVLDEVDKLLQSDFEREIQYIVAALPERRQTLAFSATFTTAQLSAVAKMMRSPQDVTVELVATSEDLAAWTERDTTSRSPELWLRDVQQFYCVVTSDSVSRAHVATDALDMHAKVVKLASLLSDVVFNQCIVFCNDKLRAEALATALAAQGWPAVCITGSQSQATRSDVMASFRACQARVLVSTDLTARGIDVDRVNFVVNLDLPRDPATYLHRVGRSGRFGGRGLAITLLAPDEVVAVEMLARVFAMRIAELPAPVPRAVFDFATRDDAARRSEDVGSVERLEHAPGARELRASGNAARVANEKTHVRDSGDAGRSSSARTDNEAATASSAPRRVRPSAVVEASEPKRDGSAHAHVAPTQQQQQAPRRHTSASAAAATHHAMTECNAAGSKTPQLVRAEHSRAFEWEEQCYAQWTALL